MISVILENQYNTNYFGDQLNFNIRIKNTGDEPLYNISVEEVLDQNGSLTISNYIEPNNQNYIIPQLNPGEENNHFYGHAYILNCSEAFQIKVNSFDGSNNIISDLSSDYSFYDDQTTFVYFDDFRYLNKGIEYEDLNGNDIVDVGDAILYTYFIYYGTNDFYNLQEVDAVFLDGNNYSMYDGKQARHYITQSEINLGYVYGKLNYSLAPCGGFLDVSQTPSCNCTIPNGYDSAINLSGLAPNQITGKVTYDQNADNCITGATIAQKRVTANSNSLSFTTFTNTVNGEYQITIPNTEQYTITSILSSYNHFTVNPSNYSITSSGQNNEYANNDFCVGSSNNYTDLGVSFYPTDGLPSRPGFISEFRLRIENLGSTNFDADLQLDFDFNKVAFFDSSEPPSVENGSNLVWQISNLLPFEIRYITVSFFVLPPPYVNSGDFLPFNLTSTTSLTDNVLSNNSFHLNQGVVNSYDPNDIRVLDKNEILVSELENDIYYLVRFQNTGTASAINVVVKQTLDNKLDWNTFEPVDSSDEALTMIKNGNEVTYTFSQINLPDSNTNEPESHGWFIYRIKPKSNLIVGDLANAQASIYFDYNLPITTNLETVEVVSLLSNSTFENNNNDISIYPNPANSFINIYTSNKVLIKSINVYNALGQKVITKENDFSKVNIEHLQNGIYFIEVNTTNEKYKLNFIKK